MKNYVDYKCLSADMLRMEAIGFVVGIMNRLLYGAKQKEKGCGGCPYYGICFDREGDEGYYGFYNVKEDDEDDEGAFMVMIAVPGEGYKVMKDDAAEKYYPELFPGGKTSKELTQIPGVNNVYYTFSSQSRRTTHGKPYVSSPVLILKINEAEGEFKCPHVTDLINAAEFLEKRKVMIGTTDGRLIPVFCLD